MEYFRDVVVKLTTEIEDLDVFTSFSIGLLSVFICIAMMRPHSQL